MSLGGVFVLWMVVERSAVIGEVCWWCVGVVSETSELEVEVVSLIQPNT